ncbi:MAG: molybdate ABC transporter substrate-binding protein [Hydrogenophilales bacterium 28-61-23]|nr:MAG: molybdate ABC transporter substrate-binding protein [Hydrogenophilales bacterium 28-61-23]
MNGLLRFFLVNTSALFVVLTAATMANASELTLALANSTCDAMNKVGDMYRARRPVQFSYICKSSGLLAKGLQGGALSADIFVSADREWMDFAIDNGLVERKQATSPWGNSLVVAVPKDSPIQRLEWKDLASGKITTILIGDPSNAPFGRHAKESLESSGLWERVKDRIETRKNIELLADSLATANASTVGILFKSNLTAQLRPLYTVKKSLHKPIRYYMAPLKTSAGKADVADFLKFMQSDAVKQIFLAENFDVSAP